jgi:hypothetical protein
MAWNSCKILSFPVILVNVKGLLGLASIPIMEPVIASRMEYADWLGLGHMPSFGAWVGWSILLESHQLGVALWPGRIRVLGKQNPSMFTMYHFSFSLSPHLWKLKKILSSTSQVWLPSSNWKMNFSVTYQSKWRPPHSLPSLISELLT